MALWVRGEGGGRPGGLRGPVLYPDTQGTRKKST